MINSIIANLRVGKPLDKEIFGKMTPDNEY
jgi:hypothetical protein